MKLQLKKNASGAYGTPDGPFEIRRAFGRCWNEVSRTVEGVEAVRRQGRVADRGHDRSVAEIGLDGASVVAVVGELEPAGMPQHVADIGCTLASPPLALRTCKRPVVRSMSSQRSATNSEALRPWR